MTHLFARMTRLMIRTESIDQAFNHFRAASAPLVRGQPGSLGILGAGNRESGSACAISFWETLEALERSNANPQVVEAMAGYARWMAGPFKIESYTVVSGTVPAPGLDHLVGTWLRTTSMQAAAGRLDDVLATYTEQLARAGASSPACVGTMLLSPRIGSSPFAIEFWTSRAAAVTWDAAVRLGDARLFRSGNVEHPPVRDILDVFGHY